MNCEHVEEILSAYLDKQLVPPEQQAISNHLETCIECNHILADFRLFDSLLSRLPRITPDQSLYERIFSSPEYCELTRTLDTVYCFDDTTPQHSLPHLVSKHPYLTPLPGGRTKQLSTDQHVALKNYATQPPRKRWIHYTRILIALILLLTLGIGGFITWNLLQRGGQVHSDAEDNMQAIKPLQKPPSAGMRFIFLRDNALWSEPINGEKNIARLTQPNIVVAEHWAIRPALVGKTAGNMLAYIDLQTARLHIIRSNGQDDSIIAESLLKSGTNPTAIWDTAMGETILTSLAWSYDGTMLAFIADPHGTGQPALYIYTINTQKVFMITLPMQGKVAHPVWSPDSKRIAFKFLHANQVGILDYNTQNHGILTILATAKSAAYPEDTVLNLNWSSNALVPTLTWNTGTLGHTHAIWTQHIGSQETMTPQLLIQGDYIQASYSDQGDNGTGGWLLIASNVGQPGDIVTVNLVGTQVRETHNKQVTTAQWAPNGKYITYLDTVSANLGTLHVINILISNDTLVSTKVSDNPSPSWSPDSLSIVYTTGLNTFVVKVPDLHTSQPLTLQGTVSTFCWSLSQPDQLILSTSDSEQGIYLMDTKNDTAVQIDDISATGSLLWIQIP
jgi:Putative zinc-finger/WD40-like Beta Propeller Repeat